MKYKIAIILTILCSMTLKAQSYSAANTTANAPKMEWWKNAKFGMFIHWGLYAVPGGIWNGKTDYGEWIMNEAKISRAEYSALSKEFNPTKFNAEEWVKLAKAAGQKYIVITSKHHADKGFNRMVDIQGFEIAGADKIFHPANVKLNNEINEIVVSSEEVNNPVAVRYCFHNFQLGNLKSQQNLPVIPFRTDNW